MTIEEKFDKEFLHGKPTKEGGIKYTLATPNKIKAFYRKEISNLKIDEFRKGYKFKDIKI